MSGEIAKTLENILDNPIVATALDRSKDIRGLVQQVVDYWSVDLNNRHPSPAFYETEEGIEHTGTDFDLLSFLMVLSQRNAVINIPSYETLRKVYLPSNQVVIGSENRHGHLLGVRSNEKTHSFSVLINDYNVMETKRDKETIGVPRLFSIVDDFGQLYKGWNSIGWKVPEWNRNYKEGSRGINRWNQLVLNDSVQLLYRIRETTSHVRVR